MIRGYCALLDSCETRPRAELQAQHLLMLERLCRHARETTDFYATRLNPLFDAADTFRLEAWADIQPLTRKDLVDEFERLKSNSIPKNFGGVRLAKSSGSTGQSVRALWTDTQVVATQCMGRRLHLWHGVDPSNLLALIFSMPMLHAETETCRDYWSPVYQALNIAGRSVTLNGQLPVKHIINRLEALKPDHLVGNPRLLFAIANDYTARDAKPEFMPKSIGTFGETRTSLIDERLREAFGVSPHSAYTAEEVGHIAIECPDCGIYHVVEEVMHADVVGSAHQPVSPGEFGHVLTTPLYSYAMPLIRYELGDEVRLAQSSCRRAQSVSIADIAGRTGDLFHHPVDGHFRPDRDLLIQVGEQLCAYSAQIVQIDPTRYLVRYQAKTPPTRQALRSAAEDVQTSFGFKASISFEPVSEIPARAGGKREDFICEFKNNLG